MEEEPLPLATYAKVLAHLVCRRDQPIGEVLAPLGVTPEQLQKADAHFNDRLCESHRLRKGVLAMTFASAFAEARKARGLFTTEPVAAPLLPAPPPTEAPALPSYMSAPTPMSPAPLPLPSPSPSPLQPTGSPTTAQMPIMQPAPSATPFRPAAAGAAPPVAAPPAAPAPRSAAPVPAGPGTGTALAPEGAPRLPDTPWDQATSRVGKLTLAHYAALTVELSRNPSDLSPLYQRYGLSGPDDLRHVHAAFQTQMQFDPQMRTQFEALVGRMRSMSMKRDA